MQKFILVFILSILFMSFSIFFYNVYIIQKDYFNQKSKETSVTQNLNPVNAEIPSTYANYSKEIYDKAIAEDRVVVLFFTSNWCVKCLSQDQLNKEVLNDLNKEGVVGLTIHILDSETTTETDALAKKFDVVKEQSLVILDKKGAVYFKYTGVLTKELLKSNIIEATIR